MKHTILSFRLIYNVQYIENIVQFTNLVVSDADVVQSPSKVRL